MKERLIDAYVEKNEFIAVVGDEKGRSRRLVHLPFRAYYEECVEPMGPKPDSVLKHFYYAEEKAILRRTYVESKRAWREASEKFAELEHADVNMLNLKPEIAMMMQRGWRIGDVFEEETQSFAPGDDAFVSQRVLSFDLETTTLNPKEPGAHVLTIGAVMCIVHADSIEYVWKRVGQLGTVNGAHPKLQRHVENSDCDVSVVQFPCDPAVEESVAAAERELCAWWSEILEEGDPDLVLVSNFHLILC